jgi:nitrogen fixation NifU-like protein
MKDKLTDWIDELQAGIMEEASETYTAEVMERWVNPRNWGQMENPDGFSAITGPCGDTMQIALKVNSGRITEVRFTTDGCATSIASGSMATELAQAKTLGEAQEISQEVILEALRGLPEESKHCALLASNVLRAAIQNYQESRTGKE